MQLKNIVAALYSSQTEAVHLANCFAHCGTVHKSAFRDALALRYGWSPARSPLKCVCGSDFAVAHALNYNTCTISTINPNQKLQVKLSTNSEKENRLAVVYSFPYKYPRFKACLFELAKDTFDQRKKQYKNSG